jgi:hypothetical protein
MENWPAMETDPGAAGAGAGDGDCGDCSRRTRSRLAPGELDQAGTKTASSFRSGGRIGEQKLLEASRTRPDTQGRRGDDDHGQHGNQLEPGRADGGGGHRNPKLVL